jgi:hypothetical protein
MKKKPKKPLDESIEKEIAGSLDADKIRAVIQAYPEHVNDHDANLLHLDAGGYESASKPIEEASDEDIATVGKVFARLFVNLKNEEIIILAHAASGKTLRQIEAATGIPRRSVYQAVMRIRETADKRVSRVLFPPREIKFPGGSVKVKYEGGI